MRVDASNRDVNGRVLQRCNG